jgi:hypothetical protein
MRFFLIACSTSVLLAGGMAANAASGGRAMRDASKVPTALPSEELLKRGAQYLDQCLGDWEPATHMTKQEWRRTCERVARERLKFLVEQAKGGDKR